jgi:hypothetical protein
LKTGTLNFYKKSSASSFTKVWGATSSSVSSWRFVQQTLTATSANAQFYARIQFQFTEASFNGYIALDDLIVHEGACIQSTSVEYCSFEDNSFCGYTNDPSVNFNWLLGNGTSQSSSTGPSKDVMIISGFVKFSLLEMFYLFFYSFSAHN